MCLKYLSKKYGINVKEMLKPPDEFNGSKLEYWCKTFYDDIPKMRSLLHNAKGKTKSYFPMENYGLTEAGYGYVGKLLKFSQPASKEKNRKNTNEVKSRYEKELESLQRSERMIARNASMTDEQKDKKKQQRSASGKAGHVTRNASMTDEHKDEKKQQRSASGKAGHVTRIASMTDEQKDEEKQQKSARAKAAHGRMTPAQKIAGNARITPEEKALTSNRKSVSAIAAHTNRKRKRKV